MSKWDGWLVPSVFCLEEDFQQRKSVSQPTSLMAKDGAERRAVCRQESRETGVSAVQYCLHVKSDLITFSMNKFHASIGLPVVWRLLIFSTL